MSRHPGSRRPESRRPGQSRLRGLTGRPKGRRPERENRLQLASALPGGSPRRQPPREPESRSSAILTSPSPAMEITAAEEEIIEAPIADEAAMTVEPAGEMPVRAAAVPQPQWFRARLPLTVTGAARITDQGLPTGTAREGTTGAVMPRIWFLSRRPQPSVTAIRTRDRREIWRNCSRFSFPNI